MSHKLPPSVSSIGFPLSAAGGSGSRRVLMTLTEAPADVAATAESIQNMKGSLGSFGKTADLLGEQTVKMIQVGGHAEIVNHISSIRPHMDGAEQKQQDQVREIEELLWKVLKQDVIEHLTALLQEGILEEIDAIVRDEVAHQRPSFIPKDIQDQLREQQRQLEELRRALHDSESPRANSMLRSHRLHEKVRPLHNPKGEISDQFPPTLGAMFAVPGETAKALLEEYGLEASDSRERNIDTFMCHCGMQYQPDPVHQGSNRGRPAVVSDTR